MTDAGYYRGTTADQDTRFGDKTKKLMKTLKFSDQLNEPVDMRKVSNLSPHYHLIRTATPVVDPNPNPYRFDSQSEISTFRLKNTPQPNFIFKLAVVVPIGGLLK